MLTSNNFTAAPQGSNSSSGTGPDTRLDANRTNFALRAVSRRAIHSL